MEGEEQQQAEEQQQVDPSVAEAAAANVELGDQEDEGQTAEGAEGTEGGEGGEGGQGDGKVEFNEAQQGAFNKAINKKVADTYKEKQRADQLQARLDAIDAGKPKPLRPAIPPIPDQFADNAQELNNTRDAAIAAAAKFDADELAATNQAANASAATEQQAIDATNVVTAAYLSRSTNLGITEPDLKQAGVVVARSGINADVVHHVCKLANGPQVTMYLSRNPVELEALNAMSPMDAAVHINSVISGKASKAGSKKKVPNPPKHLNGKGAAEGDGGPTGVSVIYE